LLFVSCQFAKQYAEGMAKRNSSSSRTKTRSAKPKAQKKAARKAAPARKAKAQKKPAKRVAAKAVAKKQPEPQPVVAAQPETVSPAWQRREDTFAPPVHEHTKPSDGRGVIRANEGKRWTARQGGRG
jgi:hypothetical protein